VLLVCGTTRVEVVDGVPPEYLAGSKKIVSDAHFPAFAEQVCALYQQIARIASEPTRATLMDFGTRLPRAVEQLVNR
jgi:hypothetical protein